MALTDKLAAIGDAIRAKSGKTAKISLDEMPSEIRALSADEVIAQADIPDYVKEAALDVANKVQSVRKDDSFVFLAMADSHHMGAEEGSWQEDINAGNLHANMAAKILAYVLDLDFATHLGDMAYGSSSTSLDLLKQQIEGVSRYLDDAYKGLPQSRIVGNHDTGVYGDTLAGTDYLYATIGNYSYLDFEDKKIRVISLNTSESEILYGDDYAAYPNYRNLSPEQLLWFAQTLYEVGSKADAAEWGVLVLGHYPLDYGGAAEASNIVKAYIDGSYTTQNGTTVLFGGHNAAKFIANIHGHTHCLLTGRLNSVSANVGTEYDAWRIATPNACFYRNNQYAGTLSNGINFSEDTTYNKEAGTARDTAFVVNVVNPSEQVIHSFCYGAGYDRVIGYGATVYHPVSVSTGAYATISNNATSVKNGDAYNATVSVSSGGRLQDVVVTMGGTDISDTAYANGVISIPAVTGAVVITILASGPAVNRIPLSTTTFGGTEIYNGIGYKTGYRINSSLQEVAVTGMCCTGFIPAAVGDVIRFKNITLAGTATPYLITYTSTGGMMASEDISVLGTADENGVYTYTIPTQANGVKIGAFRLSCGVIDSTSIITINEEI